ncbi:MAG: hypothetical protein ACYDGN_14145 [Acidimicrobiales bacterium]
MRSAAWTDSDRLADAHVGGAERCPLWRLVGRMAGPLPAADLRAGKEAQKAVQATQLRVAKVAREIIEESPALHMTGGKAPGLEAAISAAQARRNELETRLSGSQVREAAGLAV